MTEQPMKIVLLGPVPPYRGGIAHFTQSLAENLVQGGHEVLTISYLKQYPGWLYPGKSDKDYSQKTILKDVEFLFSPLNCWDWRKTLREIRDYQPDLVIYPWWVTFWAPATSWLLGKLRKFDIPAKVLVHNTFPHEEGWLDKQLTKFALKDARSFITMTEKETQRLKAVVREGSSIKTAAHPVYRQFPRSGLNKSEVRYKLGLPVGDPLALFFGFVRPYKGLDILLEAVGILKQEKVNIHLIVAGEFWQGVAEYEKLIDELGIGDIVTIRAEYIPDAEAGLYFEAADFFVAPYIDGTQSGSIKLAMGYGLPLIVTDVITDPTICAHQSGLIVVPAGDAKSLAAGMHKVENYDRSAIQGTKTFQSSWSELINALLPHSSLKDESI